MFKQNSRLLVDNNMDKKENPLYGIGKKTLSKIKKENKNLSSYIENIEFEKDINQTLSEDSNKEGLKYLGNFISSNAGERLRTIKDKISYENELRKDIIIEACTNIFMGGLVFDEDYIEKNRDYIFNLGKNIFSKYYDKVEKLEESNVLLKEFSKALKTYTKDITDSYFNGDDMNIINEKIDFCKATLFSELSLEAANLCELINQNVTHAILIEKNISDTIEKLRNEENERRLLIEQETGIYEDSSISFKIRIDRLTKPTLFQNLLTAVSKNSKINNNDDKVLSEATILYTAMETLNVLNIRKFLPNTKLSYLNEMIEIYNNK